MIVEAYRKREYRFFVELVTRHLQSHKRDKGQDTASWSPGTLSFRPVSPLLTKQEPKFKRLNKRRDKCRAYNVGRTFEEIGDASGHKDPRIFSTERFVNEAYKPH